MLLHNFIQCTFMITPTQCCLSHSFQHTSYISKDKSGYQKFEHYSKSKYYHFTNTNKYLNVKKACGISCSNFCKLSSKQKLEKHEDTVKILLAVKNSEWPKWTVCNWAKRMIFLTIGCSAATSNKKFVSNQIASQKMTIKCL